MVDQVIGGTRTPEDTRPLLLCVETGLGRPPVQQRAERALDQMLKAFTPSALFPVQKVGVGSAHLVIPCQLMHLTRSRLLQKLWHRWVCANFEIHFVVFARQATVLLVYCKEYTDRQDIPIKRYRHATDVMDRIEPGNISDMRLHRRKVLQPSMLQSGPPISPPHPTTLAAHAFTQLAHRPDILHP